ncbi:hypothetical protein [Capnocytophaga gingivalis]|uniref:6-phosphogluconate dehydrogenase n=1 Tax=Capnocytophaga gingivalis TaxID=1017 RepID=A0A250FQ15_9FLAO|nr:hypothetical protein [Capnocytophaga gingivalis]ATA87091.1 hypothetical protein CGC50_07925 [Capnocytophaga gingivalis]
MKKTLLIGLPLLLLVLGGWIYMRYYFVFAEGVKSGYLNYAVYKGDLFKTYEGKLIQEGFAKTKTGNGMQSNEFEFSIESKKIFQQLEVNSGKHFELHYREYHNALPWRGNTVYIVDSIVNMRD